MTAATNSGNGKAKIIFISKNSPTRNTNFNNVRYVKDCIKGSDVNIWNHWVEFQIIKDGVNLAFGKTPNGVTEINVEKPISRMTDGDITTENYADTDYSTTATEAKEVCATIDVGGIQNIDEIAVWHYYGDERSYNNHSLYVSPDNSNWITIINNVSGVKESANGIRVNAYE